MEKARKVRKGGSPGAVREETSLGVMASGVEVATATKAASGAGIVGSGRLDAWGDAGFERLTGGVADLTGLRAGVAIIAPLNGWIGGYL